MRLINPRLAVLALALLGLAACSKGGGQVTSDDMSLGNDKAPVTVIEYASASCSHCAAFNNDVFPAFKAKYIDTGKVRYVLREFLTPPTDVAAAGFIAARCAGRDKYFTVVDTFFHSQQQMYQSGDVGSALIAAAKAGGVDETQLKACLDDKAADAALVARVQTYEKRDNIQSTPTFLIGGQKLEGETTLDKLDAAIAAAKAHKGRGH